MIPPWRFEKIAKNVKKVIVMAGEDDGVISPEEAVKIGAGLNLAGHCEVEMRLLPPGELGHAMEPHCPAVLEQIMHWAAT